jgi:hypothetical protein
MLDNEKKSEDAVAKARVTYAPAVSNPVTVTIKQKISDLERAVKVLENWREEDKKENRKWRWITIGLAVLAIIVAIVLKAI